MTDEPVDRPYELPHLLTEAGLSVSISHSGDLATSRNLPFYAGTAVAYGMEKEAALKTITSNPAQALGIDDRVGTLEIGKDATLFVSQGDALDIRGNVLLSAYISGKRIILDNKQQELYKRYSQKYGHECCDSEINIASNLFFCIKLIYNSQHLGFMILDFRF
jgi:imidazolonepropionase-like amidohydrolase